MSHPPVMYVTFLEVSMTHDGPVLCICCRFIDSSTNSPGCPSDSVQSTEANNPMPTPNWRRHARTISVPIYHDQVSCVMVNVNSFVRRRFHHGIGPIAVCIVFFIFLLQFLYHPMSIHDDRIYHHQLLYVKLQQRFISSIRISMSLSSWVDDNICIAVLFQPFYLRISWSGSHTACWCIFLF